MSKHKSRILFTPHTPRPIFAAYMAIVAISYFCPTSQAQNSPNSHKKTQIAQNSLNTNEISLQELPKYEESLRIYHNRKFAAERKEFMETTKKKWWYYLPNIGFTFGMPTVSTNTGTLAQIDHDRISKKAKLEALQAKAEFQYREELLQLRMKYKTLLLETQTIEEETRLLNKRNGIEAIFIEGFTAQKITPLEMLREDATNVQSEIRFRDNERRLIKLFFELEAFAHYNYPNDELIKFVEMDCELKDRPTPTTRPK